MLKKTLLFMVVTSAFALTLPARVSASSTTDVPPVTITTPFGSAPQVAAPSDLLTAKQLAALIATAKTPGGPGTAAHCERFAELDRQAAKEARDLASAHEHMAAAK